MKGEPDKAMLSVSEVKFLLYHAFGWGMFLMTVLSIVLMIQLLHYAKK